VDHYNVCSSWRNKKGEINTIDNLVLYDFELFKDELFLCDNLRKEINEYDKDGKYISSIKLSATPEIIKIWNEKLFVLLHNNSIGIYDIKKKSLDVIRLNVRINEYNYCLPFFCDSLLFIPKSESFIWLESDAYVIDLSTSPNFQMISENNVYNNYSEMEFKGDDNKLNESSSIGKGSFYFYSKHYSITEKHNRYRLGSPEEYYLLDYTAHKITKLGVIPEEKYGLVLSLNQGRGFKIFQNGIFFISMTYANHKEKSLIISRISLPNKK
jgi:hypothetical protein